MYNKIKMIGLVDIPYYVYLHMDLSFHWTYR